MDRGVGDTSLLGMLLRGFRQAAGLTQHELADRAGLSLGSVRDLEQGRTRRPLPRSVAALATALGLSPAQAGELERAAAGRGLWLQILGPLAVWRDGAAVPLGGPAQRAVLGLLALSPGSLVHRSAIIDLLWPDNPPARAVNLVQAHVSRLRKLLACRDPNDGHVLCTAEAGYWLRAGPAQLDLLKFGKLTADARAAQPADGHEVACSRYQEALGLWRGDPLADVGLLRGHPAVAGLARQRAETVIEYARVASAAGWHDRALPLLRELAGREPLNERAHARLMIALAGCGQQAEALSIYHALCGRLDDELGMPPSQDLMQAHQLVLRQDIAAPAALATIAGNAGTGRARRAVEPGHEPCQMRRGTVTADRGTGTGAPASRERLAGKRPTDVARLAGHASGLKAPNRPPGDEADSDGAAARLRTGSSLPRRGRPRQSCREPEPPGPESAGTGDMPGVSSAADPASTAIFHRLCQLPADIPDFTGRLAERSQLARLLIPAEGATAVPVTVVSGPPGAGKTSLALHVAHALREHFPDGQLYVPLAGASAAPRTPGEALGELLRALGAVAGSIPREAEARSAMFRSHLAGRRVLLLADDAASAAQVRMLIPGTAGCAAVITSRDQLAGLTASHVYVESLPPHEAVEMLGRIAGAERVAADPAAAAALAAACGYLPLAVRIAGARLAARPSWPVAALTRLVAGARQRLDALATGDLEIRATLELSYQALPPPARRAFRLLALAGPFDVADWVVAALTGRDDATDVAGLLADKSMLGAGRVDAGGQPRYRLHDLLGDYAGEQLAGEPQQDRAAALDRLLRAWLQLAQCADQALPCNPYLPPAPGHLDKVVLPQHTAAVLTASPVEWFSTERLNLRHATARACDSGHLALGLHLASRQAAFHHSQARFDEAEQLWRVVNTAARSASEKAVAAHAAFGLAVTRALQGYDAEVSDVIGQCATAFEELGDQRALAWALFWQAGCAVGTGRRTEALGYVRRGLALARISHDPGAEIMLHRQAALALAGIRGHEQEGIASAERAVALARQAGEQTRELDTLRMLAHANNLAGHHSTAGRIAVQGIDLAGERHYVADRAYFTGALGDACYGLGKYRDALDAFGRALPTFREHRLRRHEALCLLKMAESHLALGETSPARAYLTECAPLFTELQLPAYIQRVQRALKECSANFT